MRSLRRQTGFLAAALLAAVCTPAKALQKCIGADGRVTYSDRGCASGDRQKNLGGASLDGVTLEYYDVSAPGGHQGHTDWYLSYQFRTHPVPGGCGVESVTTKLDLKVRLPRWRGAQPSADFDARWTRYLSALEVHEAGHVQTGRDFESNFRKAALATSAPDCGALGGAVRSRFAAMLKQAQARDVEYDAETGHGATQGAVFR